MSAVATVSSPIGILRVAAEDGGICEVDHSGGELPAARPPFDRWVEVLSSEPTGTPAARRHIEHFVTYLRTFFAGELGGEEVSLQLRGTPFQRNVWGALRRIPPGHTRTYAQVAAELGAPNAARAVGGACGRNPVLLLVPCHRVVAAKGLGGFSGGLAIKEWLLQFERAYYGMTDAGGVAR